MKLFGDTGELECWLQEVSSGDWHIYSKRLAANDTLAAGSHQAGPYIPKDILFRLFPSIYKPDCQNPDTFVPTSIDSHGIERDVRVIWYNNRTRDECRITRWGGSSSPLLDPDSTGSVVCFAVYSPHGKPGQLRIWLCSDIEEESLVEERIGPVEPGSGVYLSTEALERPSPSLEETCNLALDNIPHSWLQDFPSGPEIIEKTLELLPATSASPDKRLLRRRQCEFHVFLSVEKATVLPLIGEGFKDIGSFIKLANSVLNRRKSRAGQSLELHTSKIFLEEKVSFSHNAVSEGNKRPDFLFPSAAAYHDSSYPVKRLRTLGVKTTCKDRWRQVLNEANRIPQKHLLTLQEGVSLNQFGEMREAGVKLVVPEPLQSKYPKMIRPELQSLEGFIRDTRGHCAS